MANSSNLASLSATLAAKVESDRQQIEAQTSEQLKLHAESLRQLSSDALASTKVAMDSQSKAALKSLTGVKKQIEQQGQAVTSEIEAQTKRMLWVMKWPVLVTLALCLLICSLTWFYWTVASPWETMKIGRRNFKVITEAGWTTCTLENGNKVPCLEIN